MQMTFNESSRYTDTQIRGLLGLEKLQNGGLKPPEIENLID